ncbi:chymotrypsin-C-like [Uloborus diversus]|uniref:chymotrypsin-C-like n=1 Tax=Uloborus diversus TaxID=327109 RepID=UPI00240950AE|nr:chymotrypsin-C-like [Uloborus diversus]
MDVAHILWLVTSVLFCIQSRVFGESDDYTQDPTYIYCRYTQKFDALVNSTGHIYSPKYGEGDYPAELGCNYEISFPRNYRVKVTFKDFDIDPSDSCDQDKLEFWGEEGNNVLGIFCGSDIPRPIFSEKGDQLLRITFNTDYMGTGRGFHIYYEASPTIDDCDSGHILCKNRNCVPQSKKCDGKDDCEDGTDEQGCNFPVVTPSNCGTTPIIPNTIYGSRDRVVGGEPAKPHSWPWQVSLQKFYIEPNSHSCGGTLINSQWVLTAAHCFKYNADPYIYRIHLGSHYKYKKDSGEQIRYAERIIGYPDLEMDRLRGHFGVKDDIALIKLNAPVQFTNTVQPACVPSFGWNLPAETNCYATGWGETRGSGFAHVLKQTLQTIQSTDKCDHDTSHQICTVHPNHFNSPCHGDSGGPLACNFGGRWYVMGDTSYATHGNMLSGGLCGMPENKVIFSKVSDKANWIKDTVNKYS